jgi:hypothetical protein
MAKQANGSGERPKRFLTKSGQTRWRARYSVMEDGRQRQLLVTGKTAGEVRERVRVALDTVAQGLPVPNDRSSIAAWAQYWRSEILTNEGLAAATVQYHAWVLDNAAGPPMLKLSRRGPESCR